MVSLVGLTDTLISVLVRRVSILMPILGFPVLNFPAAGGRFSSIFSTESICLNCHIGLVKSFNPHRYVLRRGAESQHPHDFTDL